ncbi:MAG: hypothetical protein ACPGO3_03425 [Magnetospiraceae bacterium]
MVKGGNKGAARNGTVLTSAALAANIRDIRSLISTLPKGDAVSRLWDGIDRVHAYFFNEELQATETAKMASDVRSALHRRVVESLELAVFRLETGKAEEVDGILGDVADMLRKDLPG